MRASPATDGKLASVNGADSGRAAPRVVVHMPEATSRPPPSLVRVELFRMAGPVRFERRDAEVRE